MTTENVTPSQKEAAEFDAAFAEFAKSPQEGGASTEAKETPEGGDAAKETAASTDGGTDGGDPGKASTDTSKDGGASDAGKDGGEPSQDGTKDSGNSDDPWSAVPEPLRQERDRLVQSERSQRGRVSALQRELDSTRGKLAVYEKSGKDASQASPGKDGDKTTGKDAKAAADPEREQLLKEYPEVAKITAPLEKQLGDLQEENRRLAAELGGISETQKQANLDTQWNVLIEAEPHATVIAGSEPFKKWVAEQPAYVQQAVRRNHGSIVDGAEAAHVIGQFRQQTNWKPPEPTSGGKDPAKTKRERQLQSSTDVKGKGPGTASGAPDDFDRAFDYYANQKPK